MHAGVSKSLIFVVISVLVVALIYSSFTPFIVFAEKPDARWGSETCGPIPVIGNVKTCCWREKVPGQILQKEYCQTCTYLGENKGWDCKPKEAQSIAPPTTGEDVSPGDTGVFEQPPRPPSFDPTAPLQGGVFEQQEPPTPPPSGPAAPLQGDVLEQLEQGEGAAPPFVPGFLERQQLQPPADQGTGSEVPRTVEPLPPTCTPGSVFDPRINECVLENPPELCPDGSIPKSGGPGGTQPECPPSEAEEPQAEQPEAEEEEQQSPEEEDGSSEDNSNNN